MDYLQQVPLTINHVNAGLIAGTTNTLTTTVATTCSIQGKFATTHAIVTNSTFATEALTTDAVTGAAFVPLTSTATSGSACALVFGVNAAGAFKLAQGAITPTDLGVTTTPGAFILSPQFPTLPDDFCPIGYAVVRTSPTGSAFTMGSTGWAASGITSTFKNVAVLPARPQTT